MPQKKFMFGDQPVARNHYFQDSVVIFRRHCFPFFFVICHVSLHLHEIGNSHFESGPFRIQSNYIIHPGPTVGYRVTGQNAVFTFIPDHEPALGNKGMIKETKWVSGYDLAEGADLLLHDSQFTNDEYHQRRGWGHSTITDACLFASMTELKKYC